MDSTEGTSVTYYDWKTSPLTRRRLIRGAGVGAAGLAGAALVGCGESSEATPTASASGTNAPPGGTATTQATIEPGSLNPVYGGTLKIAASGDPRGLDPHVSVGGNDHSYFWMMCDSLVQYGRDGLLNSDLSLSDSWEIQDQATIVFSIREGVKFHDGSDLDAEVVSANFERILDPATASSALGAMSAIRDLEVVDARTLRVTLDAPNAAFLTNLGDRGGQILSRTYMERPLVGEGDAIIGTGPFKYEKWDRDSMVRVVKNPDYWRTDLAGNAFPYLDAVEVHSLPDANVREANLESGQVDIVAPALARMDEIEAAGRWNVAVSLGQITHILFHNTTFAPMDDVRFRRACAFAHDREGENQALYFGRHHADERPGPFPPAYQWMYRGDVPEAPNFDPAEARKLLDAAGYTPATSKFSQLSPTGAESSEKSALWASFLADVGVEMTTVQNRDSGIFYVERDPSLQSRLAQLSLRADPDGFASELLHSKAYFNPGNRTDGDFAKMDELIEAGRAEYEPEARAEIYAQVSALAGELCIQQYGTYSNVYRISNDRVGNFESIYGYEGKDRWTDIWVS